MTQKAAGDALNKRLPFTVQTPNATTARAVKELDEGRGKRFGSTEELFRDLDIRDADSEIQPVTRPYVNGHIETPVSHRPPLPGIRR